MATVYAQSGSATVLGTAQTGNADTTNTADRGAGRGSGAVVLTNTAGATPTVTVKIQGSADGTNFYSIPYALVATPSTFVVTDITVTSATTVTYLLQTDQPWRFLKLNYSANTNETLTATLYL